LLDHTLIWVLSGIWHARRLFHPVVYTRNCLASRAFHAVTTWILDQLPGLTGRSPCRLALYRRRVRGSWRASKASPVARTHSRCSQSAVTVQMPERGSAVQRCSRPRHVGLPSDTDPVSPTMDLTHGRGRCCSTTGMRRRSRDFAGRVLHD
jgi:hypothetical protein